MALSGYYVKGSVPSVDDLPLIGTVAGDAFIAGGDLWICDGSSWQRSPDGLTAAKIFSTKLIWKGISVTLVSEEDVSELFLSQYNLTKEDMALFQTTYPELFKRFRQMWAEKWAIETAKDEFDTWSDGYYEKKRRRNY